MIIDNDDTELSTEEIIEIINQLWDMGTFYLTFTGGEIFTREDLLDIARYAKKKGFLLTFMTNGGTVEFSSEITIPLSFTAECAENAEALENPSVDWNTLKLCALCDLRVDKSLVF